jgi:hypothetical protein
MGNPAIQTFMTQHPRWQFAPDQVTEHAGNQAIITTLLDASSTERLMICLDRATTRVLYIAT